MPAGIRPPLHLQTYPTLPSPRSEPQLVVRNESSRSLTYHIKKRFSQNATSFGQKLAPWKSFSLDRPIPEHDTDDQGVSSISKENRLATATMLQSQSPHHYHQQQQSQQHSADFGARATGPGQTPNVTQTVKRGLFGISRQTDPASNPDHRATHGYRDGMHETTAHGGEMADDCPDDASIFTTDLGGLRRKGSQKTQSGVSKPQPAPSIPHSHSTPSTGSRIAQFFGAGRDKSVGHKKTQRPATTDTNAGGPPPPFGQTRPHQNQGINVRVEADNGALIYDNSQGKLVPRPSDVSFDPTMEAHHANETHGNQLLSPAGKNGLGNNRLRTASGPAPLQQTMEAHSVPNKPTTNRPFGFGTKSRQPSQPNPAPASRSGTPMWKHPSATASGGQDWPRTRAERNFRFTWEANPGIVDGKELMGFGGEFGRKRVKADARMDANGRIPDARGATEVKRLPYVMGYERSVLDW